MRWWWWRLSETPIANAWMSHRCTALERLDVGATLISHTGVLSLANLTHLEHIDLYSSAMSDGALQQLVQNNSALQTLGIKYCAKLTCRGFLQVLPNLRRLRTACIRRNSWSMPELIDLLHALQQPSTVPELRVLEMNVSDAPQFTAEIHRTKQIRPQLEIRLVALKTIHTPLVDFGESR
jgi:hypothetical protein